MQKGLSLFLENNHLTECQNRCSGCCLDWFSVLRTLFKAMEECLQKHSSNWHEYTTQAFKSHTFPIGLNSTPSIWHTVLAKSRKQKTQSLSCAYMLGATKFTPVVQEPGAEGLARFSQHFPIFLAQIHGGAVGDLLLGILTLQAQRSVKEEGDFWFTAENKLN